MSSEPLPLEYLKESLMRSSDKEKFIKDKLNEFNSTLEDWKYFQIIRKQTQETQFKLLKYSEQKFSLNDYYKTIENYYKTIEKEIKFADMHILSLEEKIKYLQDMINYL